MLCSSSTNLVYPHLHVVNARLAARRHIECFASRVLTLMKVPTDAELSIQFVSLSQMRMLNNRKGKDSPTDVLSFGGSGSGHNTESYYTELLASDVLPTKRSGGSQWHESNVDRITMRDELVDLGDIFICTEYIMLRCKRFPRNHLPLSQYAVAAYIHAMLHVLGYNHESVEEYRAMVEKEKWLRQRVLRDVQRGLQLDLNSLL